MQDQTAQPPAPFENWDNPTSAYRSAPFWSWNSALDPDRLCRAIESMHRAGMGGFFMHSRYGLKTPYLGSDWFKCVDACIRKADELGMKAYLYDEDRWPSGAAGGLVTRDHVEFRGHRLTVSPLGESPAGSEHVGAFAVQKDDQGMLKGYQPLENDSTREGEALAFDNTTQETSGWANDGSYIDTMNPKAVAEFIRVTHQAYADRYQKYFGDVVPAIFTDEPQYGAAVQQMGPPLRHILHWTPNFPQEFKRRWGYDVRDHLPELALQTTEPFSKARYHYRRTATELFVDAFGAQIGAWCEKHHIALTGHWLGEESLTSQCRVVGACMMHYEHEQWPGIDILSDSAQELITAKQCSSVADQLGKPRVLSELYGCTGWDWPLEGHKFGGDWQFACGVNFRCPHLTHYSLAGGAKRDYPASIFSHSPWWPYYKSVEDYFGRLSYMLTQGKPLRDVLVIHPIESAWGVYVPPGKPLSVQPTRFAPDAVQLLLTNPLEKLMHALTEGHYDWDFGDESLLAKHARVTAAGFKVGQMTYKVVVVPASITLRSSTLKLLKKFVAAGGKVLFAGRQPDRVDAEPSGEIAALVQQSAVCGDSKQDVIAAVEKILPRRLSVAENGKELECIWSMLRTVRPTPKARSVEFLFVQSHDRAGAHDVTVKVEGHGPAVLWDCLTGVRTVLQSEQVADNVQFRLHLPATGSALVSLGMKVKGAKPAATAGKVVDIQTFAGPFDVERTEPNTLPLDMCSYRIGDGTFSSPVPSLQADAEIRKHFGLGPRKAAEHQPWYLYATGKVDLAPRGQCQVRRTFHVTDVPKVCRLAIEMPHRFSITVNGQSASEVDGWWVDDDIKTIDIAAKLSKGQNEVMISFNYQPDMELEDMYLVGEFGVSRGQYKKPEGSKDTNSRLAEPAASLVAPSSRLELGSWIGQGMDFYGGAVKYRLKVQAPPKGKRAIIRLPKVACTAAAIHTGGQTFVLPWGPFEADITSALHAGANDVIVEVIGGRKNVMGPLHVPWLAWTGPAEFEPSNSKWVKEYLLVDHGLMSPVVVETVE